MGVAACLSLALLVATGAIEVLMPPVKPRLVGQEKKEAARAAENVRWRDGSRARSIETDFRLQGRVRQWVGPYWATLMLRLRDVPEQRLVVGREGWLFYRDRLEVDPKRAAEGPPLLANLLGGIRRSLAVHGTELIVAPLPRKAVVAASELPPGLDPQPAFDAAVLAAMKDCGHRTLDLLPRWTGPGSTSMYLRHDSHWSRAGVQAFAEELLRQVPDLPRDTAEVRTMDGPVTQTLGQLGHAGLAVDHPAIDWVPRQNDPALLLLPEGREERIDSGAEPAEVLLAGSSFCRGFYGRAVLAETLQAPVRDGSVKGHPPLVAVEQSIKHCSPAELPSFLIAEFPIHQALSVGPRSSPTTRAAYATINRLTAGVPLEVLGDELLPGGKRLTPRLHQPRLDFAPGSLLSSGDGVMLIRLRVNSPEMSRWRYVCDGTTLTIKVPPGEHERLLPVIEANTPTGAFQLVPVNAAAVAAGIQTDVVTTADVRSPEHLAGAPATAGRWSFAGVQAVNVGDALVLQWDSPTLTPAVPLTLTVRGKNASGSAIHKQWTFPHAHRARVSICSLGVFERGSLTSVEVRGVGPGARATIAPLVGL